MTSRKMQIDCFGLNMSYVHSPFESDLNVESFKRGSFNLSRLPEFTSLHFVNLPC